MFDHCFCPSKTDRNGDQIPHLIMSVLDGQIVSG